MKQIAQGAEAKVYENGDVIVKERFVKTYRHSVIDSNLRKSRTKREAKVLDRLKEKGFPVPKTLRVEGKDGILHMEKISGEKLRDVFDVEYSKYASEVGKLVARLHNEGIIHGDLTTSNMMVSEGEVFLIDFGLSFFSDKVEDKAVDLHLLRQAIESKHHTVYETAFAEVLKSYEENCENSKEVLKRFEIVESRGRNKAKY
ncbi:Kae1-associated serine/threonine protein kinase [Candidatus Woesearchaeota archaeon]|jgi:TP53 regulating kinase and related kinases|nr:Kae1-associated serine/threonine protein kinase [Candidatus Woesearchaeota archaeon]MBT3538175.1 Kae1-associated serine/threonine protein kinase [Candidatus Woesearchaeota archaeon]MBT4697466.1 Kae1-associated serine/threonine protein kinase [Candidatus Woesearchaeota archaeon]MBT4716890.1 Kae1-associated serine/threonine protein kinase [Candidatus Woesearchaeota archaeon]MBT7105844.1 Kae1-associated serine/threonine protein kinase [Candidatus Woesearchaeota archaeon]